MGFANSSCSFSRFRITDQVTDSHINAIQEKLIQFSFKDIENLPEMQAHGWVCYEDMLDSQWQTAPPQKGAYVLFSLRLDTRRIPAGVIKKHVALAIKQEIERLAQNNQKFISRERKKEIREQVMLKLRERFLPVPGEFNVLWNLQNSEIWFASTQPKMIDLFIDFFLTTFDLHMELLTPYNLASFLLDEAKVAQLESIDATQFITVENP